jgi:hypothetical protein
MNSDVKMECAFQKSSGLTVTIYEFKMSFLYYFNRWLGNYDCMDWTDEIMVDNYHADECIFEPNPIHCDEHICRRESYSCGDGQCIHWFFRMAFQRSLPSMYDGCFNKRHVNYMCEITPNRRAWTGESGLCWPDEGYNDTRYPPWEMINSSKLSDKEKCEYLFRCVLSDNFEVDCPCQIHNCTQMMMNICPLDDYLVLYPPEGLINPNLAFYYNYSQLTDISDVDIMTFGGNLKCRGFHFTSHVDITEVFSLKRALNPRVYHLLCDSDYSNYGHQDFVSSLKFDKFCWNESLTFNGRSYAVNPDVCGDSGECISQYRIHDGEDDCLYDQDEETIFNINYCTGNVGRHRFQCFNDQHRCLTLSAMGTGKVHCSNNYDEMWYGNGTPISQMVYCSKDIITDCVYWKEYIIQSSIRNTTNNSLIVNSQQEMTSNLMHFRLYCDSFWNLPQQIDELTSSCQYWICSEEQYQCQTGQCIDLNWVCDGEWDCADASDEEAIIIIKKWSNHNDRLFNLTGRYQECMGRYSQSPFSKMCNTDFQFGCYLPRVSNPLDIQTNRPCINYTQIGDGIEDCYHAYDEKNTFPIYINFEIMLGFNLRCGNNDFLPYITAFYGPMYKNCTNVIRSNERDEDGSCSDPKDIICLKDNHCKKNARCNGSLECYYGEDEYWCAPGSIENQMAYRSDKEKRTHRQIISVPYYPSEGVIVSYQQKLSKPRINSQNDLFFIPYSYQCNRGVAILHMNETICLCPPAYYGDWCELFSDRISIIAHVDRKTLLNMTLKIKTNFIFDNIIIGHHEFIVIPTIENMKIIKHKFYLLYSRSVHMIEHKRKRYFNRKDVINNHPYSVNFDVFSLENNNTNSMRELGSWHYPIYFDYLPSFRLAVVLRFPSWFGNVTLDPCLQKVCNVNSTCMPILNKNNSYYCSCRHGYYGKDCEMYEHRCDGYCSSDAFCRPDYHIQTKTTHIYCICPLNRFGPHCHLKSNTCDSKPCLNNGDCIPTYDLSGEETYICICSDRFYGNQCENEKASIHISFNMTSVSSVRATVVAFYDYGAPLKLYMKHQQVYRAFPSMIHHEHPDVVAPSLGMIKIYEDLNNKPLYFIMYILNQSIINITSSPRHCPHASLLLSKGEFLEKLRM